MARDLLVAIWKVKFDVSAPWSLQTKNQRLATAVQDAYGVMHGAAQRMALDAPRYVFVAPEYYYIKDQSFALYDTNERDQIYQFVGGLTTGRPRLAVIPGTVNYKVPPPGPVPLGAKAFAGYSATPVFHGNQAIHVYDKKFNDGNIDRETDAKFIRGTRLQSFPLFALSCGLEVCGDLGEENLSQEAQNLDLEILMSCTIGHNFMTENFGKIAVRDGGYFVHCDGTGASAKNGVWRIARGTGWHGNVDMSGLGTDGFRIDPQGMHKATVAPGNVSKVGELFPKAQDADVQCYHCVL